jgi:hypothetical protein
MKPEVLLERVRDEQATTIDALGALAELFRFLHAVEAHLTVRARQEGYRWSAIDEVMGRPDDIRQLLSTWRRMSEAGL